MHENERILKFSPLIRNLYNSARESLGFEPHVSISIIDSSKNANNPLGRTAHYSPSEHKIALYTRGRHIKDIMRSLAHELVHHNQNCRGDFETAGGTMPGYAQEDGHLREMEREAYEVGNLIFRDWEDNLKDKGGKPLFSSTAPYVPAPTSGVVGGRLLEENKMENNLTKSQLQELITKELKELMEDKPLAEAPTTRRKPFPAADRQAQIGQASAAKKAAKKAADRKERSKPASQRVKELGLGRPKARVASARSMAKGKSLGVDTSMNLNTPSLDIPKVGSAAGAPVAKGKRKRRGPSPRVKRLQRALMAAGHSVGRKNDDGYMGKDTRDAIKAFQQKMVNKGINMGSSGPNKDGVDGVAGSLTRNALKGKTTAKKAAAQSSVDFEKAATVTAKAPTAKPAAVAKKPSAAAQFSTGLRGATGASPKKKGFVPLSQRIFGKSFGQKGPGSGGVVGGEKFFSDEETAAYQAKKAEKSKKYGSGIMARAKMAKWKRDNPDTRNSAQKDMDARRARADYEPTGYAAKLAKAKKQFSESKGNIMKKELKESELRDIVQEVIQEMASEKKINEFWAADAEANEAAEEEAEKAGGQPGAVYKGALEEDDQETKGYFGHEDNPETGLPRADYETDEESLYEDSGEEEGKHYRRNREEDEEHLQALEKDIDYDKRHESLKESFFPEGRSVRDKARFQTNEALMKRWGYTKKEK